MHKLYPAGSGVAGAKMNGAEFMDKLAELPLLNQPGAVWDYGFGLDLLGQVVEKVSGQMLGQYFEENIFKPLGMTDTASSFRRRRPRATPRRCRTIPTPALRRTSHRC